MSISDITITTSNYDIRSVTSVYTAPVFVPPPSIDKIEKFKNKRFLDWAKNKWRILFFIILIIFYILILSPIWSRSNDELALRGTIIHDAVRGKYIIRVMHALMSVVLPNILDTLLDLMQYREIGVSWDIHERVSFLVLSFILPLVFISYADHDIMPFLYVAMNQATSLCCLIAINSMISKLEGKGFIGMVFCVITSILFGCSTVYKVQGLFDTRYEDLGVQLAYIALSLQAITNLYWFLSVISSKLRSYGNHANLDDSNILHSTIGNIKTVYTNFTKAKLYFNNIESTVLFYFFILVLYGVCTVIINTYTNGVKWRDSNEANLIGLSICQIVILVFISGIPTRWFRCEQILVHETLAELKDHVPLVVHDHDEITVTTDNGTKVKQKGNTLATVFFANLKDVIDSNKDLPAEVLLLRLDILYTLFDYCTTLFLHLGLEKIEVEGSCYMVVCEMDRNFNHAEVIANYAVVARRAVSLVLHPVRNTQFNIRMGIHTGNIFTAKIGFLNRGETKLGNTINIAKEIATSCEFGQIWCSINTASYITKAAGDILLPVNLKKVHDRGILDKDTMQKFCILGPLTTTLSFDFILDVMDTCNTIIKKKIFDDNEVTDNGNDGDDDYDDDNNHNGV